jgi:hypothetical protein
MAPFQKKFVRKSRVLSDKEKSAQEKKSINSKQKYQNIFVDC